MAARPKALVKEPSRRAFQACVTAAAMRSARKSKQGWPVRRSGLSETFCYSTYFLSAGMKVSSISRIDCVPPLTF